MPKEGSKLEKVPQMRVAYVQLIGPYENWGRGLMELKAWLEERHVRVVGRPLGLFYDNPTETPASDLKSDACLPIEGEFAPVGKFRVKDLAAGEVAVTRHAGPPEEYTKTYGAFLEGLVNEGYTFYGPAREIFEEARLDLHPGMGVQIQQLVKKI
jgi:DNA gyrase inhibitor GyrI